MQLVPLRLLLVKSTLLLIVNEKKQRWYYSFIKKIQNTNISSPYMSGSVKALQAMSGSTWYDCFLGLWMAALRLVQRVWFF